MQARTTTTTNRINSTKPVNINISFTINPKNVLNQAAREDSSKKNGNGGLRKFRDAAHARSLVKAPTPDLISTERPMEMMIQESKTYRNRKRNSVDEAHLHRVGRGVEESEEIIKLAETAFVKKSAGKVKRKSDFSGKKTHNKTASKMSAF